MPLKETFEDIFCRTFSRRANQQYLQHVAQAFQRMSWKKFHVLLKNAVQVSGMSVYIVYECTHLCVRTCVCVCVCVVCVCCMHTCVCVQLYVNIVCVLACLLGLAHERTLSLARSTLCLLNTQFQMTEKKLCNANERDSLDAAGPNSQPAKRQRGLAAEASNADRSLQHEWATFSGVVEKFSIQCSNLQVHGRTPHISCSQLDVRIHSPV
jgi:hypothetical protein